MDVSKVVVQKMQSKNLEWEVSLVDYISNLYQLKENLDHEFATESLVPCLFPTSTKKWSELIQRFFAIIYLFFVPFKMMRANVNKWLNSSSLFVRIFPISGSERVKRKK